jgi:hypothetical protein
VNLYKGYLAICYGEEQTPATVDKIVDVTSALCIREWKRLPPIVSHIHLPFLQAAQQVATLMPNVTFVNLNIVRNNDFFLIFQEMRGR